MELIRASARGPRPTIAALLLGAATFGGLGGCMSKAVNESASVPVVPRVELQRYMGPWFIVGAIGLGLEKGAHNAVETYTLNPDGTIATVFQYRKDAFDGELETKVTRAWVVDGDNAQWKVRTFWPLKQQYLIAHLEPDYSAAIVARERRDYVWILSRDARIDEGRYQAYLRRIEAMGYDMSKFSRYPQDGRFPDQGPKIARPERASASAAR
nr:lipocalin family protein [Panacagrimonas sp.]